MVWARYFVASAKQSGLFSTIKYGPVDLKSEDIDWPFETSSYDAPIDELGCVIICETDSLGKIDSSLVIMIENKGMDKMKRGEWGYEDRVSKFSLQRSLNADIIEWCEILWHINDAIWEWFFRNVCYRIYEPTSEPRASHGSARSCSARLMARCQLWLSLLSRIRYPRASETHRYSSPFHSWYHSEPDYLDSI